MHVIKWLWGGVLLSKILFCDEQKCCIVFVYIYLPFMQMKDFTDHLSLLLTIILKLDNASVQTVEKAVIYYDLCRWKFCFEFATRKFTSLTCIVWYHAWKQLGARWDTEKPHFSCEHACKLLRAWNIVSFCNNLIEHTVSLL